MKSNHKKLLIFRSKTVEYYQFHIVQLSKWIIPSFELTSSIKLITAHQFNNVLMHFTFHFKITITLYLFIVSKHLFMRYTEENSLHSSMQSLNYHTRGWSCSPTTDIGVFNVQSSVASIKCTTDQWYLCQLHSFRKFIF